MIRELEREIPGVACRGTRPAVAGQPHDPSIDRQEAGSEPLGIARRGEPRPVAADQERGAEARDLLAPIYGRFTEGLDTRDLKEAKALLKGLEASPVTPSAAGSEGLELALKR